ncbi:Eco57I restriction-modification methylase domain-containing protein [Halomonas tibetensis]|uniref:site-specific DNA-methyltransferase (adenine-specific) n=1 Tax=Halomonas tibetensis TaxID=2259590 RepID=A0ABV7B890_9GAMM
MSAPRPFELECLALAEAALTEAVANESESARFELRMQVLEAASARFGGFDLDAFHKAFGVERKKPSNELLELAAPVVSAIEQSSIHQALALSALARETLQEHDRKSTGAYHTDFRLATRLAQLAAQNLDYKCKVIDAASGAGILLAALTHTVCGLDRAKVSYWLAHGVCAADLSINSLRAALLSLASFTDDLEALKKMRARWYCGDSLMADHKIWTKMAPDGFDAVIGNPPWEKVKLSRHEFLKSTGTQRHYGTKINGLDEMQYSIRRNQVASYSRRLLSRYPDLSNGEPDLYIAFTDLFFELCKKQGIVAVLLPGGLIRSQGTKSIRKKIFEASQSVSISIIDNRAKFFAIDSRFKFLAVAIVKSGSKKEMREPIQLLHERGTSKGLEITGNAMIGRAELGAVRQDLSLPEVRSIEEWKLYSKIAIAGIPWDKSGYCWMPKFCREVDMTKERPRFLGFPAPGALPLVEGRMVQSYRFGVKGYVSGAGRSALWETYLIGGSRLRPQFWIHASDVPRKNQHRTSELRVGFCDIAGQTNERSLMASLIPPNVVCGNKVPTILFPEDPSEERLLVWTAIANSFVFDWMLRRVLTTTVNYFLLQSVPLPKLTKDGLPWKKLAASARELHKLDEAGVTRRTLERMAQLRSEIDAEVAVAYGLDMKDMELVLQDFPIMDRGQVKIFNEEKSTITRDTALAAMAKRTEDRTTTWIHRAEEARALGAKAYVPSEIAMSCKEIENKGTKIYG